MAAKYVLAVDAGTSGVRSLLVDLNGHLVSLSHREWSYQSRDDISPFSKEFDADGFWEIICDSIKGAIKEAGASACDIIGVSATSQREGVVFLDKAGRELYAGPNTDLRALNEGVSIDSRLAKKVYSITGHLPSFLFAPAKLRWFEANQPDVFEKIATVLSISDWIIYRLSGKRVSETCGAGELGLVDIRYRQWSGQLQELLALPGNIYPELAGIGSRVGEVTPEASVETGLLVGTVVAMGGPDTHCGLIGMGAKDRGQVGVVLGWSAPVQLITDEPVFDSERRTWTCCHPLAERWILESNAGEAGGAYHWLGGIMFDRKSLREEHYRLMDWLALEAPVGAEEARAFVGPTVMDMSRPSMNFGGFIFPVPLSASHIQRSHLVRATLENLCFAIRANCQRLEVISGLKVEEIRLGGGLARSRSLVQIMPSALNMRVSVPEITEVSGLGAAMCAATGSGVYANLEEAISAMTPKLESIEPDPREALEYQEYYEKWLSTAKWLEKLSEVANEQVV